ncbi:hypothetical protein [Paraburkholderia sp. BL6665CI2N2]|uniref:hypothetical protein n=1 Tax=Paraburkholderia sp. BL6665CI2N2 TaxID=1938806 RepID=UPI0014170E01|nr:hypothetical protein [Paraburkholderia sp. BL6665CI2N2]
MRIGSMHLPQTLKAAAIISKTQPRLSAKEISGHQQYGRTTSTRMLQALPDRVKLPPYAPLTQAKACMLLSALNRDPWNPTLGRLHLSAAMEDARERYTKALTGVSERIIQRMSARFQSTLRATARRRLPKGFRDLGDRQRRFYRRQLCA